MKCLESVQFWAKSVHLLNYEKRSGLVNVNRAASLRIRAGLQEASRQADEEASSRVDLRGRSVVAELAKVDLDILTRFITGNSVAVPYA